MRKLITGLLSLAMLFSMGNVPAFAAEVPVEESTTSVTFDENSEEVTTEAFEETSEDLTYEDIQETEEEIYSEESTYIYINPLYEDVVTEEDLVSAPSSKQKARARAAASSVPATYSTVEEASEALREAMKERQTSLQFTYTTSVYYDEAGAYQESLTREIAAEALKHTGEPTEGDYLQWQYAGYQAKANYGYSTANFDTDAGMYVVDKINVTYTMTYYTTSEQEAEVDTAVDSALSNLSLDGKSDYEKIKAIYDFICDHVTYDYDNLNESAYKLKYTAYAALINQTSVCQGYANLLYRMMLTAGIDTRIITGYGVANPTTGEGEPHAWNIVNLDGVYYNVDATWDTNYHENDDYHYFLKNMSSFSDHLRDESVHDTAFYDSYPMSRTDYASEQKGNSRVKVTSKYIDGTAVNASVTGGGYYEAGTMVTLEAASVKKATFLGWYAADDSTPGYSGEKLSEDLSYRITVESVDSSYVAVYEPVGSVSLTFIGDTEKYTVNNTAASSASKEYKIGTEIVLSADAENFSFWANSYGMKISTSPSYTFTVNNAEMICPIYDVQTMIVSWESDYGQVLQRSEVSSESELKALQAPELPVRYGYSITGWDQAISNLSYEAGSLVTIKPVSVSLGTTATITTVNGTTDDGSQSQTYDMNDVAKISAYEVSYTNFQYWRDGNDNVVSYGRIFPFHVTQDEDFFAVYGEEIEAKGAANIIKTSYDTEKKQLSFVSLLNIPDTTNFEILYAGIVASEDSSVRFILDKENAAYVRGFSNPKTQTYRMTWHKGNVNVGDTWYARAYMLYSKDGVTKELYGVIQKVEVK